MKRQAPTCTAGFTLVEIMMALAIFGLVLTAIYASWTAILKASKIGLEAAAQAQRERVAIHTIEQALTSARSFAVDLQHYGFVGENGSEAILSFVARLPASFPRSGKFGDFDVRRVSFSVESVQGASDRQLVMRQSPILTEFDEDEIQHPLVLARDVKEMLLEFWDTRLGDWVDEWGQTNQLPRMVRVRLRLNAPGGQYAAQRGEEIATIVALPSVAVPPAWQVPSIQGAPGQPGGRPGVSGVPGASGTGTVPNLPQIQPQPNIRPR